MPEAPGSPPVQARDEPRFSRPLLLIILTVFLDVVGIGLIIPVAPFYATSFGADALQVGLLFTVYSAMQFLATPALGALSDRFGRRPILLISLAGEMVGFLLMGLANSLAVLYVGRIISGATAGNIGAAQAYVADITSPRERTRTFGLLGATFSFGFMFGPAMGGILSRWDIRLPAFVAAALVLVNLLGALAWLPESLPEARRHESRARPLSGQINPVVLLLWLLRRPAMPGLLAANFLLNFAFSALHTNLAVLTKDRFAWGPGDVGNVFFAMGLMGILVQTVVVRRLSERISDISLLLIGLGVLAVAFLGIGFSTVALLLWLFLPLVSAGNALGRPPLSGLVSKLVGPAEQGLANGGSQATMALASIVGPVWGGWVYERLGQSAPYWTGALLLVVAGSVTLAGGRAVLARVQMQAAALGHGRPSATASS